MTGTDLTRFADKAMFEAAPMQRDGLGRITPQVTLLSATPDPLGAMAAACRMYEGKPTYDLSDITDEERRHYWEQSLKTHLKAPWEFVDLHFFIEAVTRSWTHQAVRQRTAVFAQESLRFAVKEGFASECVLPPSIGVYDPDDTELEGPAAVWNEALRGMEQAYEKLINAGIPAEDARGLLPHCVTTRMNYKTNFRNLIDHAGNRLCTQAQFEWRAVFLEIMKAIRSYPSDVATGSWTGMAAAERGQTSVMVTPHARWQFELLATPRPETFTPICYKMGRCPFQASFDRQCTIRPRVESFAKHGVSSAMWHYDHELPDSDGLGADLRKIDPAEWMADPTAGRRD